MTFYLEATDILNIGLIVSPKNAPGSALASLTPISGYLTKPPLNCKVENEYIIIGGYQVQFLPPCEGLTDENLAQAIETDMGGGYTRLITAEHLVAIALKLGRAKDNPYL